MGGYETILLDLDRESGIAALILNRPERANAVNPRCAIEIGEAMERLHSDEAARVVIVTGAGRHFCAGADLKEAHVSPSGSPRADTSRILYHSLAESPLPVIAAINGACMGGGCEIALRCDVRIMAQGATIGLPEIRFGSLPVWGGTQALPRVIGASRAKELIFSGKHLTAEEAMEWGLVSHVVPDETLMDRARELAADFAQRPGYALAAAKFLINRSFDLGPEEGLRLERKVINGMATPEQRAAERSRAAEAQATYGKIFQKP